MAASESDPRTKRRKAAGDDPNKTMMAPQPMPGLPQDQKAGNVMNYPMSDINGQMGQQIGAGIGSMTYGDMKVPQGAPGMGQVGFVGVSGQPQNIVPGRGQNQVFGYNQAPGPTKEQEINMEPMYDMNAAMGKTMPEMSQKLFGAGQQPPYAVTALGPTGMPAPISGNLPDMRYEMPDNLPLQGNMGMSTGRGGGRNKGKG